MGRSERQAYGRPVTEPHATARILLRDDKRSVVSGDNYQLSYWDPEQLKWH
jgi:hypothetical protein